MKTLFFLWDTLTLFPRSGSITMLILIRISGLNPLWRLSTDLKEEGTYKVCTVYIKNTTVYVPSSKLGLSQPLSRQRVWPSPQNRGEGHIRMRVRGWGSPNSDDLRKSLALCLLCEGTYWPACVALWRRSAPSSGALSFLPSSSWDRPRGRAAPGYSSLAAVLPAARGITYYKAPCVFSFIH